MEIVSFTINLEHIGDIIDKNLCEVGPRRSSGAISSHRQAPVELTAFHKRVCENLQAAFGIFMTGDVETARKLLREKTELRKAELEAADRHFERLRKADRRAWRRPRYISTCSPTSSVSTRISAQVAYPVLEAAGELSALARRRTTRRTQWRFDQSCRDSHRNGRAFPLKAVPHRPG